MTQTLQQMQASQNRSMAGWDIGKLGLLMAGLGAGARGLQGLVGLGRRNLGGRDRAPGLRARTVTIPIDEEEEDKYASLKQGEFEWTSPSTWADPLTKPFSDALQGNVSTPMAQPWVLPAALLGGPLAAYGGYKLTDKLMDKRRGDEQEARLDKAKREYEEALRGRGKMGEDLDCLCELMEKESFGASDVAGIGSGVAITLGGLLALGSGMAAYDMSKQKRPDEVLRKAKLRRDRERMRRVPPPIFARVGRVPDEDELEGEPLDKAAGIDWDGRLKKLHARRPDLLGFKEAYDSQESRQPETPGFPNPIPIGSMSNAPTTPPPPPEPPEPPAPTTAPSPTPPAPLPSK